jgi:hypothetical protein
MPKWPKFLGVNVNVINKTGGVAGSVGMSHALWQKHDGYTLCGLSESNVTAGVQGGWDKKFDVWETFIVGGSPDVISVTPDTPYKTLQDLIEAAKKAPGSIKAAASGAGSIHHLNLLAVEKGSGADFNFIPYKGSAPSQNAAMTGRSLRGGHLPGRTAAAAARWETACPGHADPRWVRWLKGWEPSLIFRCLSGPVRIPAHLPGHRFCRSGRRPGRRQIRAGGRLQQGHGHR